MKIFLAVTAAALLSAASASAQDGQAFTDEHPWYVALDAGYHWPRTVNSHSTGLAPDGRPYDWRWKTASSWAMLAKVGYRLTRHMRLEAETGYFNSSLLSVHAPGGTNGGVSIERPGEPYGLCSPASVPPACIPAGATPNSLTWMWTGMANAIFDLAPGKRLDPFVGVGVGIAHVEWAGHALSYAFSNVPGTISASNPAIQTLKNAGTLDRVSQVAVQFLAGVSYPVRPRINLDMTYRQYLTPGSPRWNPENDTPGLPVGAGLRPGDFLGRFQDQSVTLGVRYAF